MARSKVQLAGRRPDTINKPWDLAPKIKALVSPGPIFAQDKSSEYLFVISGSYYSSSREQQDVPIHHASPTLSPFNWFESSPLLPDLLESDLLALRC